MTKLHGVRLGSVALGLFIAWSDVSQAEPARWNVNAEHSNIEFRVAHMVVSKTTCKKTAGGYEARCGSSRCAK